MNETMVTLWHNVEANIRMVAVGVFIFLLLIVIMLKSTESADTSAPEATAGPVPAAGPAGAPGAPKAAGMVVVDPSAEKVKAIVEGPKASISNSPFASLMSSSMFDIKAVQNAVALEAQANQRFEDATRLFGERKWRDALDVCKEVLVIRPGHLRAQEVKTTLEETLKGAGVLRSDSGQAAVASPTPAVPGPVTPGHGLPVPGGR